jgi:hypothetical protein
MAIPRIDPNVRYVGVSELRKLNSDKLRQLPSAIVIQDNGEALAIILPMSTFLRMQDLIQQEGKQ